MDWLVPVRSGDYNEELRFALRSWVANAGMVEGLDRLVIVGSVLPPWLRPDVFLPGNLHRTGPINVYCNIRDACTSGYLGEQVIVANDDFYAMEPTDPTLIAHRGSLAEHLRRLQVGTWWERSIRLTRVPLRGVPDPLSYELHRPLLVDTAAMGEILTRAWTGHGIPPQWRTVYGNLHGIGGEQASDGKVIRSKGLPSGPWWSTTDGSWRTHEAAKVIRARFTVPTVWEVVESDDEPANERSTL